VERVFADAYVYMWIATASTGLFCKYCSTCVNEDESSVEQEDKRQPDPLSKLPLK